MAANFPPPPTPAIDWTNIGFKVREVNGHVESHFSHSGGAQWSTPRFVKSPFLQLHGMAPVYNYGQQAYEGMKAFRHPPSASHPNGRIVIFRPDRNAARLHHSAQFVSIPPVPKEHFVNCIVRAVSANAEFVPPNETRAAMYIRPLLLGSSAQLGLTPPDEYTFVVFVMPTGVYHGVHAERDGQVTLVFPDSKNVIDSVTAASVKEIGEHMLGYKVEKRSVKYDELSSFDEVMAAGTAAALVPIRSITMKSKDDKFEYDAGAAGEGGEVFNKLIKTLQGIQLGEIEDKFGWLVDAEKLEDGWTEQ
ncbi:branched-chain amino acid aminotransferase [Trichophyton equinum CBS 127.97]|uniref:Branched-chain amino acid aminotransferase n=1 Tax=Trichophyton equinum (strain ATCC MYA-4606 / CBS 127.97) TaxID=559882 RepID=F2Q5K2_TRIEC|nr:branched-chain amino acid aminotransferase [Trichophyton equinum CBS 127.97]